MPKLSIQYFAILREQRGVAREQLDTPAATPAELYNELSARHHFTLPPDRIRAAVNSDFVSPTAPLHDGDEVTFIPPVAGG